MPEGANQRRGRFELAFSQIGGTVCVGRFFQVFVVSMINFSKFYFKQILLKQSASSVR